MISGVILLKAFLGCVLLAPLLAFWRTRQGEEPFGNWVVRAEQAVSLRLFARLRGSPWVTPVTYRLKEAFYIENTRIYKLLYDKGFED